MSAVEPTTPTPARSRRDVLCGLMVALVAPGALVAACSDSSDGSGSGGGTTNGAGSTAPPGTAGTTGSPSGLAALADVPDGGGLVVDNPAGGKILLVRTGDEVVAYNAACTHQGTPVEAPVDGVALCPNHGSQFTTSDGAVRRGPATQPLGKIEVTVEGDQIVLA